MTNSRDIGLRSASAGKGDAPRHNLAAFRKGYGLIQWRTRRETPPLPVPDGLYGRVYEPGKVRPFDGFEAGAYAVELQSGKVYFKTLASGARRRSEIFTPADVAQAVERGSWALLKTIKYKTRPSKRAVVALAHSQML